MGMGVGHHSVEQNDAHCVVGDALTEDHTEKLGLLLIFHYGDGCHHVRGTDQAAHQQDLHHRKLEGFRNTIERSLSD